jgi:glycosidase
VGGVSGGAKGIANYMGGDWAGVTQKINDNYFNDLGVNTLWLTVPLENTDQSGKGVGGDNNTYSAYHGYWPKLDSNDPATLAQEGCFGTMAELKALVAAAHQKGLKVLYDYAMVHVHNTSGIVASHGDWFWPNDNGKGGDCICGEGCSWDALPDRERCWFTGYLPHWNYTNAAARNYSVTNAIEWVKQTGIDGFRADAIKHIDMSWLTELRSRVKTEIIANQTPQQRFYMVGETYDFGNRDTLKAYVDPATKLDGQFDFPLRKNILEAVILRKYQGMKNLADFMGGNDYFYGAQAVMSTFIGNHDLPRVIHLGQNNRIWGDDQGADGKNLAWNNQPGLPGEREAFERVANGFAVIATNRGAPLIYYGDELGLPGAGDPDNRRFMQWSGLSANQVFLFERVKALFKIRSEHPALRRGVRQNLAADDDTWLYARTTTGDTVYVAINRADTARSAGILPTGSYTELLTGEAHPGGNVQVPPRQTRIYVKK